MKPLRRWLVGVILTIELALILTKGMAVHRVVWQGDAPVSFGAIAAVNERLLGRPLWLVTAGRVRRWLEGERVAKVRVGWRLPDTVVITAEAPEFIGIIPKRDKAVVVDEQGRSWATVPFWSTRLPALLLPEKVPIQNCMVAVRQALKVCAEQDVPTRAVWVSPFGEVAVSLPDGSWLRLGNPSALLLKVQLGKALRRQRWLPAHSVADLTLPTTISLWSLERKEGDR